MAKPSFELDFLAPRKTKDRPFSPKARIVLKSFTQDTAEGLPFVATGGNFKELDAAVKRLIKELKSIRKDAKRKFEAHKKHLAKANRRK